jgi:thioredoxin reductase (NADPH)
VVLGAGVAGLTAAFTAARFGLRTIVVEQRGPGGQIMTATTIENLPGVEPVDGDTLGPRLYEQAESAGAEIRLETVEALELDGDVRVVRCGGETLRARAVVIAVGSSLRPLGIPGEAELYGRGVSHCASCDAAFFAGRDVGVIGGGDAAYDEALVVARHARAVTIYQRGPARAQAALRERVAAAPNVAVAEGVAVEAILGERNVTGLRVRDGDATHDVATSGVFVYAGLAPNTAFLGDAVALDAAGHVVTDLAMRTSVAGVYAAGDCRAQSVRLLAACAGDGATAAVSAVRYRQASIEIDVR